MTDLQRLRVLREVAQYGSFSKAAAALHVTASAVSQQIAALERGLGAAVVERSPRGVVLTESGRLLVEAEEIVSAELRHVRDRIARLAAGRARLTVATFTSGGRHLLPAALAHFAVGHPDVELNVVQHEPEDALPLLREGGADLALAYHFDGPVPVRAGDRSGLAWEPLMEDPMSAVLPAGHPLAGRDAVDLSELAEDTWVMGCSKTAAYLRRLAATAGFELKVSGSTTDYFFAVSLVAAGLGVTLVPFVSLVNLPPDVAVVPLRPPRPTRYLGIATARRGRALPYTEAFAAALRKAAEPARTGA
ncbi:LysR family transcriptional regulator [Yinghuangia soli]|uniref:LysR family transcriptional regulator n=1 Tax=Yinghuangia soli TaxID=2908204 RepID=A0AA41PYB5_9ACTN|nr:LysR family transcriptional regulator [Yinghuangia soli]MCF2527921.1 LysR family transcriptional regulator [Yinghuangia soli]